MLVDYGRAAAPPRRVPPLVGENRPERLVVMFPAPKKRSPQDTFARRAQLPQRSIPPGVGHRRARLETMRAERVEGELDRQPRAVGEESRAPELRRERKSPLRD